MSTPVEEGGIDGSLSNKRKALPWLLGTIKHLEVKMSFEPSTKQQYKGTSIK
jgi:hypothetical protein